MKPGSSSSSSQDEQQASCRGSASSLHKTQDKASEIKGIMMLQEQNQELHHSLLQTAMRMECMGEEFKSSHELLESELQRTHVELSSLLDKFKRLQDNYSSTQQTNNLLERKLHSVAQNMDGERERLNQRILVLTDQLAKARITIHSMESIHVRTPSPPPDQHS
ncbi:tight junction-associated protein 1 [Hypomesus transpacificus]|uniref:tight junction-associated protein 1 n=1 Tax=Hypomesus transpacificus TaxID=137520 RepID=UPI001F081EDD|nr:tight junction-associated protein 1 [Hypomesus transpacificus]